MKTKRIKLSIWKIMKLREITRGSKTMRWGTNLVQLKFLKKIARITQRAIVRD